LLQSHSRKKTAENNNKAVYNVYVNPGKNINNQQGDIVHLDDDGTLNPDRLPALVRSFRKSVSGGDREKALNVSADIQNALERLLELDNKGY
jgi:hypothetical protein